MKLRIQIVGSPASSVSEFTGPAVTIGRDSTCDLRVNGSANPGVSGNHAQIVLSPDGAFLIDLNSTNGTFLNDRRVYERQKLQQGDYFCLGQTGATFQIIELDLRQARQSRIPGTIIEKKLDDDAMRVPEPNYPVQSRACAKERAKPVPAKDTPLSVANQSSAPAGAAGQTRLMVVSLQKTNRNLMIGAGVVVLAALFIGGVTGIYFIWKTHDLSSQTATLGAAAKTLHEKQEDLHQSVGKVSSNLEKLNQKERDVYKRLLPSTAWIIKPLMKDASIGTGSLVDRERRLVLSNLSCFLHLIMKAT